MEGIDIIMNINIVTVKRIESNSGALQFFEANRDFSFDIKRLYYITDVMEGTERGKHAHKNLKQFIFCPYGATLLKLDDGFEKKDVLLDTPNKAVIIEGCVWRDILWQRDNSVLCVAASEYYDESDYIRDYDEFLKYINKEKNHES